LLGFEFANILLNRLDKDSVQLILRKNGATIGSNCDIESGQTFHNCRDYSNLVVGDHCHIGKNCFFDLRNKVIIGNNVTVSMECGFITHMDVGKSRLSKEYPSRNLPIAIEANVYLGARAIVLMGCCLHSDSIVAAGALVTKDVPQATIVAGIPAQVKTKL